MHGVNKHSLSMNMCTGGGPQGPKTEEMLCKCHFSPFFSFSAHVVAILSPSNFVLILPPKFQPKYHSFAYHCTLLCKNSFFAWKTIETKLIFMSFEE